MLTEKTTIWEKYGLNIDEKTTGEKMWLKYWQNTLLIVLG